MQQEWADYRVFLREFRRTFHTTGAVLPSGRALSRALTRYVRDEKEKGVRNLFTERPAGCAAQKVPDPFSRRILEVGPGTGAVTARIIRDMRPNDQLALVERNDQFVARLRQRIAKDETFRSIAGRVELIHAGVEELPEDRPFDVIISGLPLNNFPVALVEQIAAKLRRLLAPYGTLSFFEYIAVRRVKSLISRRDERVRLTGVGRLLAEVLTTSQIKRDLVLFNIPPAWVHHVQFKAGSRE